MKLAAGVVGGALAVATLGGTALAQGDSAPACNIMDLYSHLAGVSPLPLPPTFPLCPCPALLTLWARLGYLQLSRPTPTASLGETAGVDRQCLSLAMSGTRAPWMNAT